jgi:hypothetical protein
VGLLAWLFWWGATGLDGVAWPRAVRLLVVDNLCIKGTPANYGLRVNSAPVLF